jgi:ribosome biogenesis GTPase / thiamine phosphate phosphatase
VTPPLPHAGLVVSTHGRHCIVEDAHGQRVRCHPRGKRQVAVVGDRVQWLPSADEGTIEAIEPRRNLLYRQDDVRTKSFAANLDQVLVLVAAEPVFSETQLARALIAAHAEGIPALVALNKRDLGAAFERAWERLAPYRQMGETVLPLSLRSEDDPGMDALRQRLQGLCTLVLGPSGAGKSTLVNRLLPAAPQVQTAEISRALNSGRHTTTATHWYWLDGQRQSALIDSPGFQEFGLLHLSAEGLAACMPDLAQHLGHCRFHNCSHRHEPGCGVRAAVGRPGPEGISDSRWRLYEQLHAELSVPARH